MQICRSVEHCRQEQQFVKCLVQNSQILLKFLKILGFLTHVYSVLCPN